METITPTSKWARWRLKSPASPLLIQRKHQSSASLAFAWGIHRWPVSSPHKRPAENTSIWWRHRDFLHMVFWMESFDLPNPQHWRHMGAMASRSRVTGNFTDCSAAPSGKQVRRQIVHITGPLWGKPQVTSCSPNKGPVIWKVYYFDRNCTEMHSCGTSHFSDGKFYWRICITEIQGIQSYLLVVCQLT